MAKKQHKNLQERLEKRQRLQQIVAQSGDYTAVLVDKPVVAAADAVKAAPAIAVQGESHSKEIRHTLVSLVIIAILLVASVYADHHTSYFATFGNWLYTSLKLSS